MHHSASYNRQLDSSIGKRGIIPLRASSLILGGFLIAFTVWGLVPGSATHVVAQSSSASWSDPQNLSDPNVDAWAATMATDVAGNVHVIWSQTMTDERLAGEGDTLFYTRWDGTAWTPLVDVLVSPSGVAQNPEMAISESGMLHVVWSSGGEESRLLYSRAPACCADDPAHWSKPTSLDLRTLATAAILSDDTGRLHVAYSLNDTSSINYQYSDDEGDTWSRPIELPNGARRFDEYAIWPRLAANTDGTIHLVWTNLPYPGYAVLYARSEDGGPTWSQPEIIDSSDRADYATNYGPIYIDVEAHGENEVHLIWDGAPTVERNHIWSNDGGKTWSAIDKVFPEITGVGRSGWNDMAFDSAGILHAISFISPAHPVHATWDNAMWSATEPVSTTGPGASGAELVNLAISRGNTLHVVWSKKDVRPYTNWYARKEVPAPELGAQNLPNLTTLQPESTKTAPSQGTPSPSPSPTLTPPQIDEMEDYPWYTPLIENSMFPLLAGVLPTLLLVATVVLIVVRRRHKFGNGY